MMTFRAFSNAIKKRFLKSDINQFGHRNHFVDMDFEAEKTELS